jgi:hypothetical protein
MIEQAPIAVLALVIGAMLEPAFSALCRFTGRKRGSAEQARLPADRPELIDSITEAPPAPTSAASEPRLTRKVIQLCERTAPEHAHALLSWLQAPGGLTGEVSVAELKEIHADMCVAYSWSERSWVAVGRELRRILEQPKTYGVRGGQKVRVYRIPTVVRSAERIPLRQVA